MLTREELERYKTLLSSLPPNSKEIGKIHTLLQSHKKDMNKENFMSFVKDMWSAFIPGKHHQIMANAFERVASGDLKRLIINMPPRHTKSEFASFLLPAWFLGKFPEKKIIQTAHTAELSVGFGRKVRNLVSSSDYQAVFNTKLSSDSKAAGRWNTHVGGEYFAIGVGGAVTGKGADLLIIDDPHSEQEAMQNDPKIYDKTFEWYSSGPRQRLQPGGAIVMVMCMTGDTEVLMANGATTPLRDVRPGDMVATFYKGRLGVSKINNWRSSGVDSIYTVQTQSGIILRANKRHPFLVSNEGVLEWTRLKDLKLGMLLVATMDASAPQDHKLNPENARLAKLVPAITEKTLTRHITPLGITGSGKGKNADVGSQLKPRDCAIHATQSNTHQQSQPQRKTELDVLNTGMASPLKFIRKWLRIVITDVMSAGSILLQQIQGRIGAVSCVSTTATIREKSEVFFATTVTSQLDMGKPQKSCLEPLNTYKVFLDPIVSIASSGEEEVFDVEVDRTENFIANGVVSHNTRWAKRDLTGQILEHSASRGGDQWEVIEFPALMPSGNPLWPEFWSKEELESIMAELPVSKWQSQYQQNPTSEEGAIIKREMWNIWEGERAPKCDYIIQSWDTAFEKHNRADFSACTTWGIFYRENEEGKDIANVILLDAFKERIEFPDLKRAAYEFWKQWNPDTLIVEKKAAGAPLIYEMRSMGIPVSEYTPTKGSDKIARVNAISDMFASGLVWCPNTRWAEEVIEEMAAFPYGDNDDLVDSTSQALLRFRQGGFIRAPSDEPEAIKRFKSRRGQAYY